MSSPATVAPPLSHVSRAMNWHVNVTNEAYKLAINYIFYGLSH